MITLAIHGGAGNIRPQFLTKELEDSYTHALQDALDKGYEVLASGGSSMDAVVQAIMSLENEPLFNAGRGSVFTKKRIA